MKHQTFKETINELEKKLAQLKSQTQDFIELTEKAIGLCNKVIFEFRTLVLKDGFNNPDEEIHFFKHVKPRVSSALIFYTEMFIIESHRPNSGKKEQIKYLKDRTKKYCKYLIDNRDFYQYYKRKKTFSDNHYFLRGNANKQIHIDFIGSHIDPDFSTGYDQVLAKILAFEQLKKYVGNEIDRLKINSTNIIEDKENNKIISNLEWTGSRVAAVELIYALYYSKVINDGRAGINEIAKAFEIIFNIQLEDIYRTFKDIQGRTSLRVKFLDDLKETLLRKLNDLDK